MKRIIAAVLIIFWFAGCANHYIKKTFYPQPVTNFPFDPKPFHVKSRTTIENYSCVDSAHGNSWHPDTTREVYNRTGGLVSVYYYNHGNTQSPEIRKTYSYNSKNCLIADSIFHDQQLIFATAYNYNLFPKQVSEITNSIKGDTITKEITRFRKGKAVYGIELDKKGDTVYSFLRNENIETSTWYRYKKEKKDSLILYRKDIVVTDPKARITSTVHYSPTGFEHDNPLMEQVFDAKGRLLSETVYEENGAIYYSAMNEYSANGLLQKSTLSSYEKNGKLSSYNTNKYFYNQKRQIIKVEHFDEKNTIAVTVDIYSYNERGLLAQVQTIGAESIHNHCVLFSYTYY